MILRVSLTGFYAQALQRKHPEWRGFPVVATKQKQVIDVSSEAVLRQVSPGMAESEAKAILREDGRYVEIIADEYIRDRNEWLDICLDYSSIIEADTPSSAYVDLIGHPEPDLIATWLGRQIQIKSGLAIAMGLAPSKWIAQLATRTVDLASASLGIPALEAINDPENFLAPLPTKLLISVAPAIRERLIFLGYRRIGHIANAPLSVLTTQFGSQAIVIYEAVRGKRLNEITGSYPEPSISKSVRFEGTLCDSTLLYEALRQLAQTVAIELSSLDKVAQSFLLIFELPEGRRLRFSRTLIKATYSAGQLMQGFATGLGELALQEGVLAIRANVFGLKPSGRTQRTLEDKLSHRDRETSATQTFQRMKACYGDDKLKIASEIVVPRREKLLRLWRETSGWRAI